MKIYRFHPETGAYLGEDFADESSAARGCYVVPDDATTLAPPASEKRGVPFFNAEARAWELRMPPVTGTTILSRVLFDSAGDGGEP